MHGSELAPDRRMLVIWQDPATREFHQVGVLTLPAGDGVFRFEYRPLLPSGFHPFLAFPDPDRVYESSRLFPFFQSRVMSAERPEFDDHLRALGLSRDEATPFEILARTAGERPTDTVQVVPDAQESDGTIDQLFLASGVRHLPGAEEGIAKLRTGDELQLVGDSENPHDLRAILLNTRTGVRVGYVPQYLLDAVHKWLEERDVAVVVVRANGPSVPWHLRLLCRLTAGKRHEPTARST